jgi:hypothetical protein
MYVYFHSFLNSELLGGVGSRHNLECLGQVTMNSKWGKVRKEMANSYFQVLFRHLTADKGIICGTSNSHIPGKLGISKK